MQKPTQLVLILTTWLALLTWGIVSLLIFLGVPNHVQVLVNDESIAKIMNACPTSNVICNGLHAIAPTISNVFERSAPMRHYAIISLIVYIVLLTISALRTGYTRFEWSFRPWHILLTFTAMVWLVFTIYTLQPAPEGQISVRQIIGPDPAIFAGLSADGLKATGVYIEDLRDKNCVIVSGSTPGGYEIFTMRYRCIQIFFVTRVFSQIVFLSVVSLLLSATGLWILKRCKLAHLHPYVHSFLALITGAATWIALLWILALLKIYTTPIAWGLLFAVAVFVRKELLEICKNFHTERIVIKEEWYSFALFAGWLLLSLLAVNFFTVVRPFPIGWDDLGVYLNEPRLLVSYGGMTPFMGIMRWEYLTSLGYLLFGYEPPFAATASLMINWLAGALAVGSLLLFGTTFVRWRVAVLAALLYYCLPIVQHFAFADMKTDNAVFMFQCTALFVAMYGVHMYKSHVKSARTLLVLSGIILGFAFATKPTSVMMLFTILPILAGYFVNLLAFITVTLLALIVYNLQGILSFQKIFDRINVDFSVILTLVIIILAAAILAAIAFVRAKKNAVLFSYTAGRVVLGMIVAIVPWLIVTNISHGTLTSPKLHMSLYNVLDPNITYENLPANLAVDLTHEACTSTSHKEELDRYWGNRSGLQHFLMLPWRSVMNLDVNGYYVTSYQYILLLPLLLLVPWFWRKEQKLVRYMMLATVFFVLQWALLANGVVWYGIGMFAGITLGLAMLAYESPLATRIPLFGFLLLSLVTAFSLRFWQFEMQKGLFDYTFGRIDARLMAERTVPHYDNIRTQIETMQQQQPDQSLVYRIGTFIPYFLPKNLEVFGRTDHQLDFFNCLSQEGDHNKTLQRLQALGFGSIVFDTNTATIERVPGTLHRKVDKFITFLNAPGLGIQAFIADTRAGVAYFILPKR